MSNETQPIVWPGQPDVPAHLRGTYEGLATAPVIEYLTRPGVTTAIELMPHSFMPGEPNACMLKGVAIACPPDNYEDEQGILYHNNRDGTFTDVSQPAGIIRKDPGRGFGVVFGDFNNDGRQASRGMIPAQASTTSITAMAPSRTPVGLPDWVWTGRAQSK